MEDWISALQVLRIFSAVAFPPMSNIRCRMRASRRVLFEFEWLLVRAWLRAWLRAFRLSQGYVNAELSVGLLHPPGPLEIRRRGEMNRRDIDSWDWCDEFVDENSRGSISSTPASFSLSISLVTRGWVKLILKSRGKNYTKRYVIIR